MKTTIKIESVTSIDFNKSGFHYATITKVVTSVQHSGTVKINRMTSLESMHIKTIMGRRSRTSKRSLVFINPDREVAASFPYVKLITILTGDTVHTSFRFRTGIIANKLGDRVQGNLKIKDDLKERTNLLLEVVSKQGTKGTQILESDE